jgi:hypothetical protein
MTLTKKLEKTLGEAKRKVEMVQGQEIEQAEITPLE